MESLNTVETTCWIGNDGVLSGRNVFKDTQIRHVFTT